MSTHERRGIIFTFASSPYTHLKDNQHFYQMLYSIETIRQFCDIPVKVFLSPPGEMQHAWLKPHELFSGVEIVEFVNDLDALYSTYACYDFAGKLDHRWRNLMRSFELFDFDRILFLDGDTLFSRSPHELFDKYSDTSCVWARHDLPSPVTIKLDMLDGINDGQILLSRQIYDKVKTVFYEQHKQAIYDLLLSTRDQLYGDEHSYFQWLSSQYAAAKTFNDNHISVKYFDNADASLSTEPTFTHTETDCVGIRSIVHHYFFGNTHRYLPVKYWCRARRTEYMRMLRGRRLCRCGHIS